MPKRKPITPYATNSFHLFTYPCYGTPDGHPSHTAHSGQLVQIIRQLTDEECALECQPMYKIRAADMWVGTARHEELTPRKPTSAWIEKAFWNELHALRRRFPMCYLQAWMPNDFVGDAQTANWTAIKHVQIAGRLERGFDATLGTNWQSVENAKRNL